MMRLRADMGRYLLLGLEFLIAADIIDSIIHRDMESLAELAIIVVIRTVISYFLEKEIEAIEKGA